MTRWILPALALVIAGCQPAEVPQPLPPAPEFISEKPDPQGIFAEIIGVSDGDSLTARIEGQPVKVRLEGIDAPELKQPGGSASRDALRALTTRGPYYIVPTGKDRYGRTLARVEAAGNEVNVAMLKEGHAWHFTRYNKDADLAEAETEARQAQRGIWATPGAVPPWEWRKAKQQGETTGPQP